MKRKISAFLLTFALVLGAVSFSACNSPLPTDLIVDNPQTVFYIGDKFTFGNRAVVKIQTGHNISTYSASEFVYDYNTKIATANGVYVDFSDFDSAFETTDSSPQTICVVYGDYSNQKQTDLKETYSISVGMHQNQWKTAPQITGWTYGDEANVPTAEAECNNENITFSYYEKQSPQNVVYLPNDVLAMKNALSELDAGNYVLTTYVASSATYASLSDTKEFTVAKKRINISLPNNAGSATYTGYALKSNLIDTAYYTVTNNGGTSVGFYPVYLTLKNSNYDWPEGTQVNGENQVVILFEITPAE